MARIYRLEGDIDLAERYYRLALEQEGAFVIPDEAHLLRIELAHMYRQNGRDTEYRNMILRVIREDPIFSEGAQNGRRAAMRERLYEDGLNRVLVLYRLDFPQALEAHRSYASYLSRQSDTESQNEAVEHLMFAVVEIAGRAINAIIERESDYQFTTVSDMLLTAQRYANIREYLNDMDFLTLLLQLSAQLERTDREAGADVAADIRREVQATLSLQR
jgi:hypothetical protein